MHSFEASSSICLTDDLVTDLIENVIIIIRQVYKGRGEKGVKTQGYRVTKKIVTGALA